MKVILDANVLLSFLLAPDEDGVISWLVRTCLNSPDIIVLTPEELWRETVHIAETKPYFRAKIPAQQLWSFLERLAIQSVTPSRRMGDVPSYSRDAKDDYLLVYALELEVDYLVTGDRDLLILGSMANLSIVSPAAFGRLLVAQGWLRD